MDMGILRKAQLLPKHGDNVQLVEDQLRRAFVSNATPGHWHLSLPRLYPVLERILRQEELLSPKSSRPELLQAMERYVKTYNLPMMHTFKGHSPKPIRARLPEKKKTGTITYYNIM